MADYIERQAAIDALDGIFDNVPMELTTEILRLRRKLRALPSADVVPVVHAHWIQTSAEDENGNAYYSCSNCECGESHNPIVEVPYCWKCGAKMNAQGEE